MDFVDVTYAPAADATVYFYLLDTCSKIYYVTKCVALMSYDIFSVY